MRQALLLSLFALGTSTAVFAASCGTFASPTACSITVNGNTLFTLGSFNFTNPVGLGGGTVYQAGDVSIDIFTGGGGTMLVTFSKNPNGPTDVGSVFFANAGRESAFTLQYSATISAVTPGTVAYITPSIVSFGLNNATNNAVATNQMILSGSPGVSCQAIVNDLANNQGNCNSLPGGLGLTMNVSNIVDFVGNTGNVSFGSTSNLLSSSFTADTSGVPEPSTFLLMGAGLAAIGWIRIRKQNAIRGGSKVRSAPSENEAPAS